MNARFVTACRYCARLAVGLSLCWAAQAVQASWKAGVALTNITPVTALWMAGYASRTHPAQGAASELWVKALALEDAAGHRALILTSDLLAIRGSLYRACLPQFKALGLEPAQVLFTASHTHCGPLLPNRPGSLAALTPIERSQVEQYTVELQARIVGTAARALAQLAPVRLAAGQAQADFAANRRNNVPRPRPPAQPSGQRQPTNSTPAETELCPPSTKPGVPGAPVGPVDHSVPVLAVRRPDGTLLAVLFGYACHNTTLTPAFDRWCGDYAGFAQAELERRHPGAAALFFLGCAGDQDPVLRGGLALAQRHGASLARAVDEVLRTQPAALAPELKTTMETLDLALGPPPTIAQLEKLQTSQVPYLRRWATNLLARLHAGEPVERTSPYPVQVWRLGERQLWILLGGEPVVDYALKFKREWGAQTWIAGYANDVMCYIPSRRVLEEDKPPLASPRWGYEGSQAMQVLGLPAYRWADDVEDRITASVRRLAQEAARP